MKKSQSSVFCVLKSSINLIELCSVYRLYPRLLISSIKFIDQFFSVQFQSEEYMYWFSFRSNAKILQIWLKDLNKNLHLILNVNKVLGRSPWETRKGTDFLFLRKRKKDRWKQSTRGPRTSGVAVVSTYVTRCLQQRHPTFQQKLVKTNDKVATPTLMRGRYCPMCSSVCVTLVSVLVSAGESRSGNQWESLQSRESLIFEQQRT